MYAIHPAALQLCGSLDCERDRLTGVRIRSQLAQVGTLTLWLGCLGLRNLANKSPVSLIL